MNGPCDRCGQQVRDEATPYLAKRHPLQPWQRVDADTGLRHYCPLELPKKEELMQGTCNLCGRETWVSLAWGYYDEGKQYVEMEEAALLCAQCHHGGPKEPGEMPAAKVQKMPEGILAVEEERVS